jgi:hypothetical protein
MKSKPYLSPQKSGPTHLYCFCVINNEKYVKVFTSKNTLKPFAF